MKKLSTYAPRLFLGLAAAAALLLFFATSSGARPAMADGGCPSAGIHAQDGCCETPAGIHALDGCCDGFVAGIHAVVDGCCGFVAGIHADGCCDRGIPAAGIHGTVPLCPTICGDDLSLTATPASVAKMSGIGAMRQIEITGHDLSAQDGSYKIWVSPAPKLNPPYGGFESIFVPNTTGSGSLATSTSSTSAITPDLRDATIKISIGTRTAGVYHIVVHCMETEGTGITFIGTAILDVIVS